MKIAIGGKGGVGKTTLCALLAREAASCGYRVLAVDADPNPTLAAALGFSQEITPLVELRELIEERLGSSEGFFRLNPKVDDIPERFAIEKDGIRLLVMGPIRQGGEGCACPQNTFLKGLLQHIVLERDELVLLDLEAGLEPLGRATAQGVDSVLIVVEPDAPSLITAGRISKLASDIGLNEIFAVANKVRAPEDSDYIKEHLPSGLELLGSLPESEAIRRAGRKQTAAAGGSTGGTTAATKKPKSNFIEDPQVRREVQEILKRLQTFIMRRKGGRQDGANLL